MSPDVVRVDLTNVPLYHGGARRLEPGELLLPPIRTGQPSSARPDWVYVTIDVDLARYHAAMYAGRSGGGRTIKGRGAVYEVMPLDTSLEHPDEGDPPGYVFAVPAARIVRVVERQVRFDLPAGHDLDDLATVIAARGGLTLNERTGLGRRTVAAGRA